MEKTDFNRQDRQAEVLPVAQTPAKPPRLKEEPLMAVTQPTAMNPATNMNSGSISTVTSNIANAAKTDSTRQSASLSNSKESTRKKEAEATAVGKGPCKTVEKSPKIEKKATTATEENANILYAFNDEQSRRKNRNAGWYVGAGVNPGSSGFNVKGRNLSYDSANPPDVDLDKDPDKDPDKDKEGKENGTRASAPYTRSGAGYRDYNDVSHHHFMPISFSLTVSKSLSGIFSLETGLTYSYLHSTFETDLSKSHCQWHYLGIPLRLNIHTFSTGRLRLYATVGGDVAIPFYAKAVRDRASTGTDLWEGSFRASTVWSLSASYGASIRLADRIDLFIEPTLQYHFEHRQKVPNIWTDNSWGFSIPLGFRFSW